MKHFQTEPYTNLILVHRKVNTCINTNREIIKKKVNPMIALQMFPIKTLISLEAQLSDITVFQ